VWGVVPPPVAKRRIDKEVRSVGEWAVRAAVDKQEMARQLTVSITSAASVHRGAAAEAGVEVGAPKQAADNPYRSSVTAPA
jgi:hypothetical protein